MMYVCEESVYIEYIVIDAPDAPWREAKLVLNPFRMWRICLESRYLQSAIRWQHRGLAAISERPIIRAVGH